MTTQQTDELKQLYITLTQHDHDLTLHRLRLQRDRHEAWAIACNYDTAGSVDAGYQQAVIAIADTLVILREERRAIKEAVNNSDLIRSWYREALEGERDRT